MKLAYYFRTNIFISYSRRDIVFVEKLFENLNNTKYNVFLDKERIYIGENFSTRIIKEIKNCDAIIFVGTKHSVGSEWCKAEVNNAIALNKEYLALLDEDAINSEFTKLYDFKNYVHLNVLEDIKSYIDPIDKMLRSRRQKKKIKSLFWIFLLVASLMFAFSFIDIIENNVIHFQNVQNNEKVIKRLESTNKILSFSKIDDLLKQVSDKLNLKRELMILNEKNEYGSVQFFNSMLLINRIDTLFENNKRYYVDSINFQKIQFKKDYLNNITFMNPVIFSKSLFEFVEISNVMWNCEISETDFSKCQFLGSDFNARLSEVNFINCKFKGGIFNFKNSVYTKVINLNPVEKSGIIKDDFGYFENVTIENSAPKIDPTVIDLTDPDTEIRFKSILFMNCHFKGIYKSHFFEGCTFENCIFPIDFDINILGKQNIVQGCLNSNSVCI